MSSNHSRFYSHRAIICLTLMILFGIFGSLRAQDASVTDVPTETSAPSVEPTTEIPTDAPTLETPTEIPTDAPTDVPTDAPTAATTDVPTEAATVEVTTEVTPSPTAVIEPPVFNFLNGTAFEGTAGVDLLIEASVSDSLGVVRVLAEGSTGTVSLTTVEPTETAAPYVTAFTLTYTAGADFTGVDSIILTAINGAGVQVSTTLTVNVSPAVTATLTPTPSPEPVEERIIKYNPAASEASIQAMLTSLGAIEISRLPQIGAMRVYIPESVSQPVTAMATVQSVGAASLAGVTAVEENVNFQLMYTPNDSQFNQQWGLGGVSPATYVSPYGIEVQRAWDISTTRGTGIKVAVVDSGVDLQHEDLLYQTVPGWDFVNDDNSPDDDMGHGTHVAGIIAAKTNNLKGIASIAYNARILPVKVCGANPVDDPTQGEGCQLYYVAEGIIYATDMGAQIINLSLGSIVDSPTIRGAIQYALSRNVVVIAAAGNCGQSPGNSSCGVPYDSNTPMYPASYPGVISVGSHDDTGAISAFSSHNPGSVTLSAPGENILSLQAGTGTTASTTYVMQSGTSMSAAFVSGTAALLMSAKIATTPDTVRDALICGAQDAGAAGRDDYFGYGMLKADASMTWNTNGAGNPANCKVTLPNDDFQFAKVITAIPFSFTQAISDRTVTEQISDPQICGANREQTVWYSYKPAINQYYQFSTLGSSYNTVLDVFRGGEGVLTSVGCTTTNKQLAIPLDAAQTYYIAVATNGAVVNDQVLQLRVNAALPTNNLDYQENALNFAYVGMWSRTYLLGSSGSYVQQTSDPNAMAAFSFRGTSFDYVRTLGPDRGAVQFYINGALATVMVNGNPTTSISNWGVITKANQSINIPVPSAVTGKWNTVYIIRDSAVPGMVDIDRIRTYDFDTNVVAGTITAKADDKDVRLRYDANWSLPQQYTGAYLGYVKPTSVTGAKVNFRFSGNALTIFRITGPSGMADIQVTIDNGMPIIIKNNFVGTTAISRPYTINGLTTTTHVVEMTNTGANGTLVQLDAVQPATMVNLLAPTVYDDRSTYIAYRNTWTDIPAVPGAYLGTIRALDIGSEASFKFTGNDLCVQYQLPNSPLQVWIDGVQKATIAEGSGSTITTWCYESSQLTLLADTVHYVNLIAKDDGVTAHTFRLDKVQPKRYLTLTAARKIVQETDPAFIYSTPANWTTQSVAATSLGGFRPQGGYMKRSNIDNTNITFYINGTGFILYTSVGTNNACWAIKIDSNPIRHLMDSGVAVSNGGRYQPIGIGVVEVTPGVPTVPPAAPGWATPPVPLTPGIHRIQLIVDADCSDEVPPPPLVGPNVDFDAVRVFP